MKFAKLIMKTLKMFHGKHFAMKRMQIRQRKGAQNEFVCKRIFFAGFGLLFITVSAC